MMPAAQSLVCCNVVLNAALAAALVVRKSHAICYNARWVGGYTACRIPLVRSANGNENGILLNKIPFNGILFPFVSVKKIFEVPFPFVSLKTNFESSIKFPFLLAAAYFRTL